VKSVFVITRLTLLEAARRRILLAAFVLGVVFLALFSLGFHFMSLTVQSVQDTIVSRQMAFGEFYNFVLMAGLYAISFLSIAMGAMLAADTLAGEIGSGTIQSIVAKPIRRFEIVLGKWLGFSVLLGAYLAVMVGGVVGSVWLQTGYLPPNLLPGLSLMYHAVDLGDRRCGFRLVRDRFPGGVGGAAGFLRLESDGGAGGDRVQPDHPERGALEAGCLRNDVSLRSGVRLLPLFIPFGPQHGHGGLRRRLPCGLSGDGHPTIQSAGPLREGARAAACRIWWGPGNRLTPASEIGYPDLPTIVDQQVLVVGGPRQAGSVVPIVPI
jgi:hypothetical protein